MTAILHSFAEHAGSHRQADKVTGSYCVGDVPVVLSVRSPRVCLAFRSLEACRVAGDQRTASLLVPRVSKSDFCKRSVAGLRCVASVYGPSPKNVLQGTFKKIRRAARTDKFLRMSRLLVRTKPSQCFSLRELPMSSAKVSSAQFVSAQSSWRPLSSVVKQVLRDVRVEPPVAPQPQAVTLQ